MGEYIPSTSKWVSEQVELYESSGGKEGTTMNGLPVIIVTNLSLIHISEHTRRYAIA